MTHTLLAVFAHPDDEVFGSGGTLAKYADQGIRVILACATRGEVGEIADPSLATPETLGEVREHELRASAAALGFDDVRFLGYRDSGMPGTPDNDHPESYHRADPEAAIGQLVALIRETRPQVVITFEPFGGYGHPDHIAASRFTTAAFDAAGDPTQYPQAGPPWKPARLFYTMIPMKFWRDLQARLQEAGADTSDFARFDELAKHRPPDEKITTVIDVMPYVDVKWKAANSHLTQFGMTSRWKRLPEAVMRELTGREYFWQVRPRYDEPAANDLFAGLREEEAESRS